MEAEVAPLVWSSVLSVTWESLLWGQVTAPAQQGPCKLPAAAAYTGLPTGLLFRRLVRNESGAVGRPSGTYARFKKEQTDGPRVDSVPFEKAIQSSLWQPPCQLTTGHWPLSPHPSKLSSSPFKSLMCKVTKAPMLLNNGAAAGTCTQNTPRIRQSRIFVDTYATFYTWMNQSGWHWFGCLQDCLLRWKHFLLLNRRILKCLETWTKMFAFFWVAIYSQQTNKKNVQGCQNTYSGGFHTGKYVNHCCVKMQKTMFHTSTSDLAKVAKVRLGEVTNPPTSYSQPCLWNYMLSPI